MKIERKAELRRKMAAIPQVARAELRKALEVSASEMVSTARSFAPVDSGALRTSIDHTFGEYKAANANVRGVRAGGGVGDKDLSVTIHAGDASAYYAAFVEFGTQDSVAQPYFFPAYRLTKKRVRGRMNRALKVAAKKVASS